MVEVHRLQEVAAVRHGILHAPPILQDILYLVVQHGRQVVDLVVGGHHAFRVAFLRAVAERLQLVVILHLVGDIKAVVGAPVLLVVGVEMLEHRAGPDAVAPLSGRHRRPVIVVLVLHAPDIRGSHLAGKIRILAVAFLVPAPPRIAAHVDRGRQAAVPALADRVREGPGFLPGDVAGLENQVLIKGRRHPDGLGKGRGRGRRVHFPLPGPGLHAVRAFPAAGGNGQAQALVADAQAEPGKLFLNGQPGNEVFRPFPVRQAGIIQGCVAVHTAFLRYGYDPAGRPFSPFRPSCRCFCFLSGFIL